MAVRNWGYCDLSVSRSFDLEKLEFIKQLGFNTIAINTHVEEVGDEPKKKKKKGEVKDKQDYIPNPLEVGDIAERSKLNILQRVTIEISDSSIMPKINHSENLKKYDLIAVLPKTLQAFQLACGSLDIDIITFEPETRIPFKVTRKLYRQAADKGIFFELMYSAAIKDSTSRKNIISTSHTYHAIGKSKNIIITSGADQHAYVRGVHDVINLGFILGLNGNESLEVIRNNPRKVILKAEGRKCGKLYMNIESVQEDDQNDNKIMETYFSFYSYPQQSHYTKTMIYC